MRPPDNRGERKLDHGAKGLVPRNHTSERGAHLIIRLDESNPELRAEYVLVSQFTEYLHFAGKGGPVCSGRNETAATTPTTFSGRSW